MKRLGALLASLLLAGSLTACGGTAAQEMQSIQVFAMDTVIGLRACGGETEAALAAAEDEIYRLDEALSRTREDSAVSRLNSAAGGTPVDVGEELRDLIARALDFSAATDGAFDITLAPVSSAWGFTEDTYRVPEDAELALLLPCVGADGAAGNGTMCDALSTALFVMGEDRALELWRSGVYDFDLILVTEDGRLLATAGIADRFRPDDSAGYAYEIVS